MARISLWSILFGVAACVLPIVVSSTPESSSHSAADTLRQTETMVILPEEDDHEIYCDCAWERWPGQSCEETRHKSGFPCWSDCCSKAHGPR